jgi:hypothetical protein
VSHNELQARLKEVLKEHQRDGLSMIGNVDKLAATLANAVQEWIEEHDAARQQQAPQKKSA